jgi:hypothetical protein
MNYDTPEQAVCQEEQEAFDPTQVVDQMFSSMSFEERS